MIAVYEVLRIIDSLSSPLPVSYGKDSLLCIEEKKGYITQAVLSSFFRKSPHEPQGGHYEPSHKTRKTNTQ